MSTSCFATGMTFNFKWFLKLWSNQSLHPPVSLVQHRTTNSWWRTGLCLTQLCFPAVHFLTCWTNKKLWYYYYYDYYYYYYYFLLHLMDAWCLPLCNTAYLCQHFKLLKLFIMYYVLNADNVMRKGCRLKEKHLRRCDLCFLQAAFVRILSFHICKSQVGGFCRLFS